MKPELTFPPVTRRLMRPRPTTSVRRWLVWGCVSLAAHSLLFTGLGQWIATALPLPVISVTLVSDPTRTGTPTEVAGGGAPVASQAAPAASPARQQQPDPPTAQPVQPTAASTQTRTPTPTPDPQPVTTTSAPSDLPPLPEQARRPLAFVRHTPPAITPATVSTMPPATDSVTGSIRSADTQITPSRWAAANAFSPSAGATHPARPVAGMGGNPAPRYPRMARKRGIEGKVLLRVEVQPDGQASTVSVHRSSGSRLLDREARRTVEGWHFDPARQVGRAVAGSVDVPIVFRLNG